MAINNQKAVIGSEYLAYGGINQVWQCNSISTALTKTISNDPGNIGISNPCIFVQFLNGHSSADATLSLNALGHTGQIQAYIENNTYFGWGPIYSRIDADVVLCLQWDDSKWRVVGNPIVYSRIFTGNIYKSCGFCYANRFKQASICVTGNTSGNTSFNYGIEFEDKNQMSITATLHGQAPGAAVVASYDTLSCTVDFSNGTASGTKKGFIQVMGF